MFCQMMRTRFALKNRASNAGRELGLSLFHLAGIGRTIQEQFSLAGNIALHIAPYHVPPDQRGQSFERGQTRQALIPQVHNTAQARMSATKTIMSTTRAPTYLKMPG